MSSPPRPKVSVLLITYNHGPFIAEALDSVLAQQTDFDIEIVVGDDHSSDETPEIVAAYAERRSDVIRARLNEVNIGGHRNFMGTLARCRGEYVALLDGDDFWTDPDKLQQQADHLDRDAGCALVFHPADVLGADGGRQPWYPPGRRPSYDLHDLLRGNFIATGSVMCRNGRVTEYPAWHEEVKVTPGDWLFFCLHARHGTIGYIDRVMSVYRQHETGVWAGSTTEERIRGLRASIEVCRNLNADFDHAYTASVRRAVAVTRVKIVVQRTVPFLVEPLASLRGRLTSRSRSDEAA